MGWPLLFSGNTYKCESKYSNWEGECNIDKACAANAPIEILGSYTVTQDFKLICDRASWKAFANTMFFFSTILSGILFPFLSDSRGRLLALQFALAAGGAAFFAAGLAPSVFYWTIAVSVVGFAISGLEIVSLVFVAEISAKRFRNHAMVALTTMWAVS